jgi:hypothetical protein
MHAPLISVPTARVHHPFWPKPLLQIAGWASGDVRCLDTIPDCAFRAPPNWAEFAVVALLFAWVLPVLVALVSTGDVKTVHNTTTTIGVKAWWAVVAVLVEVLMQCAVNLQRVKVSTSAANSSEEVAQTMLSFKDVLVSLLAVVPTMLQV